MSITAHQEKIVRDKFNELANLCFNDCAVYLEAFLKVMRQNEIMHHNSDYDFASFAHEAFLHNLESFIAEENGVRITKDILK